MGFIANIKLALLAIGKVIAKPRFLVIAVLAAFIMLAILVWLFNIGLFLFVIKSDVLSFAEKLGFFGSSFTGIFKNLDDYRALAMVAVSVLTGVNFAVLMFVLRSTAKAKTKGGKGVLVALLGSGCVACGGSILSPLLAQLGSAASIAVSQSIGVIAYSAALMLIAYSLYGLGLSAAHIQSLGINKINKKGG